MCKYSGRCGACSGIYEDVSVQLAGKSKYIRDLFADIPCDNICDCVGDYYPYKYRNKVHLAFGELKGKTIIGFYEDGSTKITDIDGCILMGDWVSRLISILREFVSRFKIRPYNKFEGRGVIRYAHARCIDERIQLTLVTTTTNFPGRDWLYNKLCTQFKDVSLYLNINKRTDHAIFDNNFKFIKGSKYLNFNFCGVDVSLSPNSFLQVNLSIAGKMYKKAMEMLDIHPDTTVIDLYSGIGITSIMFAKNASKVIAIEEVPEATQNAKAMCRINGVDNVMCMCGKCEEKIGSIRGEEDMVMFLDPARAGVEEGVIRAINALSPRKIVYMSCNPETCVRDIKHILSDNKYVVTDIIPYNMFPYTKHIETLVCLQKQE